MWNPKKDINDLIGRTETDTQELKRVRRKKGGGGGMDWGFEIDIGTLRCIA